MPWQPIYRWESGRAQRRSSLSARGVRGLEEPSGESGGTAEGPGRETRSRETAQRAVNAMWEGASGELRTPPLPLSRDAILEGENICSAGDRVGGVCQLPQGSAGPPAASTPASLPSPLALELLPASKHFPPCWKQSCSLEHKGRKNELEDLQLASWHPI